MHATKKSENKTKRLSTRSSERRATLQGRLNSGSRETKRERRGGGGEKETEKNEENEDDDED